MVRYHTGTSYLIENLMDIDNWFVNLFELNSHDLRWLDEESFAYLDINHDGVITPDELAQRVEEGGLSAAPTPSTEATEASPFKRPTGRRQRPGAGHAQDVARAVQLPHHR